MSDNNTNAAPTYHPHHGDDLEAASLEEEAYAALYEALAADEAEEVDSAG